jgi:hypothetical protein
MGLREQCPISRTPIQGLELQAIHKHGENLMLRRGGAPNKAAKSQSRVGRKACQGERANLEYVREVLRNESQESIAGYMYT